MLSLSREYQEKDLLGIDLICMWKIELAPYLISSFISHVSKTLFAIVNMITT